MARDRILITVKTYPTLSRKYGETVCTAGIREDGSWIRLYPVPFRKLGEKEQYQKYDWVECETIKRDNDPRPESHIPRNLDELICVDHMGTEDRWRERRNFLLKKAKVFTRLEEVIQGAKTNVMSLAIFRPTEVTGFIHEDEEREWDPEKVAEMRMKHEQGDLFSAATWEKTFKLIQKLPYSFSYRFVDADGKKSELQILDWEAGALYWNCLRSSHGDEMKALEKVRQKYFVDFLKTDLHFYLGTTQQFHSFAPNPWVIIGVLPIPHETQIGLL